VAARQRIGVNELEALIDALEASARGRFVSWDARLWRELVDGPAATLAAGLDGTVGMAGRAALVSYLRLACEGVGLGYLFPAAAGREGFLDQAFVSMVPRLLPAVPVERQPQTLAALWNLGENLESAAPWLRRIFLRLCAALPALGDLDALVADVERQALAPPAIVLGAAPRVAWIALGAEDRRFLPGALHFVAPTVVCVHDRARVGPTQGVWLADPPLALGPMGCVEWPEASRPWRAPTADVRLTPSFATITNGWRAAATLVTSQALVGWLP
jgi:hypothetical protein